MHTYEVQKFDLPALEGISPKSLEEHISLYQGYVKNFNAISNSITDYLEDSEKNVHAISELTRRKSFEFDGMRLHELYFNQWEGGAKTLATGSPLSSALTETFGSADSLVMQMTQTGMMRGPGWSILYADPQVKTFHIGFSEQQHQGHFATLPVLLALDVWEHAFLLDYGTQGKAKYIEAFFKNLNWQTVENRFTSASV